MTVYDFSVNDVYGNPVLLQTYAGKVLLIVNTATRCGLTRQYQDLQNLYKKYNSQGFEILDFPCNQFANQAPESDLEIANFCQLNYKTTFKTFAKIKVNGNGQHPLYRYLKKQKPGIFGSMIKWNFTKFLINRQGIVSDRFEPGDTSDRYESKIQRLLSEDVTIIP